MAVHSGTRGRPVFHCGVASAANHQSSLSLLLIEIETDFTHSDLEEHTSLLMESNSPGRKYIITVNRTALIQIYDNRTSIFLLSSWYQSHQLPDSYRWNTKRLRDARSTVTVLNWLSLVVGYQYRCFWLLSLILPVPQLPNSHVPNCRQRL